jgi:hypothetical protein
VVFKVRVRNADLCRASASLLLRPSSHFSLRSSLTHSPPTVGFNPSPPPPHIIVDRQMNREF